MKPEQQLVEAALNGCEESFEALARVPALRFRGRAARAVGSSDADDVVQDALLLAFRRLSTFRGDSSFSSWFFTIGSNCIRMHLRSAYVQRCLISSDVVERCLADTPHLDQHEVKQELQATLREIDLLCKGYRDPLLAGLNYPGTLKLLAAEMGVAYPWLKTRINRARIALRKALAHRDPR